MRLACLFLALPLISCANDYPSAHGRATSILPQGDGGRGLWVRQPINAIGGSEAAQAYYKRLPNFQTPPKPAPDVPKPIKSPQELAQDEQALSGTRQKANVDAQRGTPEQVKTQQSDAELAALRERTRARAAAEAKD